VPDFEATSFGIEEGKSELEGSCFRLLKELDLDAFFDGIGIPDAGFGALLLESGLF
jgi:hypothetical protein